MKKMSQLSFLIANQSEEISAKFSIEETAAHGRELKSPSQGEHACAVSMFPNKKDKQKALTFEGNKIHCPPRDQ